MKKVLFLIHDLGQGGAERVLVNLVNHMNHREFDITVMTLFDHGENRKLLNNIIHYKSWMPLMIKGNSHLMKLFTPEQLHKMIIKDKYDIEIAYLEGPTSRVISGCTDEDTITVSWIHNKPLSIEGIARSFRNVEEAKQSYKSFNKIVFVSEDVQNSFIKLVDSSLPVQVLYNTNDTEKIILLSKEEVDLSSNDSIITLTAVGKLLNSKGFDRLIRIIERLVREQYPIRLLILGDGPEKGNYIKYIHTAGLENNILLLGFQMNPYKYVAKSDLFVCSSLSEGFSTAATEALILGIPVCTVEVSGMREMLGNSEYGLIVPNSEEALYQGIKKLLDDSTLLEHYKKQAEIRGKAFKREETVKAVENMLKELSEGAV